MGKDHRGHPSGSNKQESSGIKPVMTSENLEGSEKMRKKYTKDEDQLPDNVKQKHPNSNTNNAILQPPASDIKPSDANC